jgi:hypothetical protein
VGCCLLGCPVVLLTRALLLPSRNSRSCWDNIRVLGKFRDHDKLTRLDDSCGRIYLLWCTRTESPIGRKSGPNGLETDFTTAFEIRHQVQSVHMDPLFSGERCWMNRWRNMVSDNYICSFVYTPVSAIKQPSKEWKRAIQTKQIKTIQSISEIYINRKQKPSKKNTTLLF